MLKETTLFLLSVWLVVSVSLADSDNASCDKVLETMVNGCKNIRNSMLSISSLEPKNVCCTNFRYNMCVQSVKGYATIAKPTRVCEESVYENQINSLTSNLAMEAIKKVCDKFDTQTCITDSVSQAWSQISSVLNPEKLGDSISTNFNSAFDSIKNFGKNIGDQISSQNIPDKIKEGAISLQNRFAEKTKGLTELVSGGQSHFNRYSLLDNDQQGLESSDSFSFKRLFDSLIPSVEVVHKRSSSESSSNGVWSFLDRLSPKQDTEKNKVETGANPYSGTR